MSSPIAAKLEGQNQGNPGIRMLYVFRQGDLPKVDLQVDRGTDFTAWKAQWEAYMRLSGLDKIPRQTGESAHPVFLLRDTDYCQQPRSALQQNRGGVSPPLWSPCNANLKATSTNWLGQNLKLLLC